MGAPGELAIILHTHMPYVEGFGTWPFGEEWLWEAIATSYMPLLGVLGRAPVTLSLTPVLCDQLEAPGAMERCLNFLEEIRPESHRRDLEHFRREGQPAFAAELERSAAEYAGGAARLRELGPGGLLEALGRYAAWTSAATHAILPMLASETLVSVQIRSGIASHRRRFGEWAGGFWLPECAYVPWIDPLLEEAGVRSACIELTSKWGLGDRRHLQPLATEDRLVLWPVDRQTMSLAWGDDGYPGHGLYRDYHGLTAHHHRVWSNDGSPYDHEVATALARADARDFVSRVRNRAREGGVCVCALDTELLGHWWYEGVIWLEAVLDEATSQGVALTTLDDALEHCDPAPVREDLGVSSWGDGGDLRTWSAPAVADLAWRARSCELALLASGRRPHDRALRELLALQSSDWAFLATRRLAGDYPHERALGHAEALASALADQGQAIEPGLRNLAPDLEGWIG